MTRSDILTKLETAESKVWLKAKLFGNEVYDGAQVRQIALDAGSSDGVIITHASYRGISISWLTLSTEVIVCGGFCRIIPLARKADSLYGFQFRRNLNLCVHLAW